MSISEQTYELVALEDGDDQWELVCGRLRKKPEMTIPHNQSMRLLNRQLVLQLDPDKYVVSENSAKLRTSTASYFVPDLCVLPLKLVRRTFAARPDRLEEYDEAVPLVVEVWSPSTGDYDVDAKLPEYQQRGDREIWLLHPHDRTLIAWRRRPDGAYEHTEHRSGRIEPVALPGVAIALMALFAV